MISLLGKMGSVLLYLFLSRMLDFNNEFTEKRGIYMSIKKIIESIQSYETIIIHRHIRPDPDAIGSQGGLKEIIKASFPEKSLCRW